MAGLALALLSLGLGLGPDGAAPVPDAGVLLGPREQATLFARHLLAGDLDALVAFSPPGFSFDGRQVWSEAELRAEWLRALERRPLAGVPLNGVELAPFDAFVKAHGKPPTRLAGVNLTGATIATLDLGGRPVLVFFKQRGAAWVPFGVSD